MRNGPQADLRFAICSDGERSAARKLFRLGGIATKSSSKLVRLYFRVLGQIARVHHSTLTAYSSCLALARSMLSRLRWAQNSEHGACTSMLGPPRLVSHAPARRPARLLQQHPVLKAIPSRTSTRFLGKSARGSFNRRIFSSSGCSFPQSRNQSLHTRVHKCEGESP